MMDQCSASNMLQYRQNQTCPEGITAVDRQKGKKKQGKVQKRERNETERGEKKRTSKTGIQ